MALEVRPFHPADRAPLSELFRYAGEGSPTGSLWGHPASEAQIYLDPYVELEPESLFVAQVDGALVGYLTGCLDTESFPGEGTRMQAAIREHRLVLKRGPRSFFLRAGLDSIRLLLRRQPTAGEFTDPRWPAHLHINVAPAARGTGAAQGLMQSWLGRVEEAGVPGCHLQTLVENTRAVRFFERAGFVPFGPRPQVPGIRHEGAVLHQLTMVRPAPA